MNTLPAFSARFPVNLEMMNPFYQQKINYLSAMQREQQRLQLLKQIQEIHFHKQIQNFYAAQQQNLQHYYLKQNLSTASYSEKGVTSPISPLEQQQIRLQGSSLKAQITNMMDFFINKFDRVPQEEVSQQRALYSSNPTLLKLFDKLVQRYSASGKSREDMIRSVLRGALKFLKDSYRTKFHLTSKAASIKLCEKYFKPDDMSNVNFDDEDQVLSFLLPYKKNSRNKTPNTKFITEIFASEEFRQDYTEYLESYDETFQEDNQKKVARFNEFLLKCAEDDAIERVQNYKRLPWLKAWQEATKIIALELLDKKLQYSLNKKVQDKETRKQRKC